MMNTYLTKVATSSHKTYQPFNADATSKKILKHKLLADDRTQITAT